jgi:uncharacterized protein with NRDE domain
MHADWPVILLGNRDEFHGRPSAALHRWEEADHVIGGRDLQSGGTWLGVSEAGRLAVVTNVRGYGMPNPALESRGTLLRHFLLGSGAFADPEITDLGRFNPFNLFVLNGEKLSLMSNRPSDVNHSLGSGFYGLSNGPHDELWPRTAATKGAISEWLKETASDPVQMLDQIGPNHATARFRPLEALTDPAEIPVFIRGESYGTRCSTVVAINRHGEGIIAERQFNTNAHQSKKTEILFKWPQEIPKI